MGCRLVIQSRRVFRRLGLHSTTVEGMYGFKTTGLGLIFVWSAEGTKVLRMASGRFRSVSSEGTQRRTVCSREKCIPEASTERRVIILTDTRIPTVVCSVRCPIVWLGFLGRAI